EAAELQEHFLWVTPEQSHARAQERLDKVTEEIADIGMYLFEMADNLGIDLLAAMEEKLRRNAENYPVEKAKGRSDKYTEL
ncbi:MAG: MazG-like family protein, partial [Desulfobacterales bacterium]|nr:MazG-like family protein [Desulfobacterales bacterium]